MKIKRGKHIMIFIVLAIFFIFIITDCSDQPTEPEEVVQQDSLVTMADKKAIE